jgi:hypothetical protein
MTKITSFFQPKGIPSKSAGNAMNKRLRDNVDTTSKRTCSRGESSAVDELLSYLDDGLLDTASEEGDEHSKRDAICSHVSWKNALEKHFQSASFASLTQFVAKERATQTIYPAAADTWAALNVCPLQSIKVVIVGQDPYHGAGQAHGLSFSVLPGQAAPPSLKNMSVICRCVCVCDCFPER